jgi:hypothetical protein
MSNLVKYCGGCGESFSIYDTRHTCSLNRYKEDESPEDVDEEIEEVSGVKDKRTYPEPRTDYSYIANSDDDIVEVHEYESEKHLVIKMSPIEAILKTCAIFVCLAAGVAGFAFALFLLHIIFSALGK